MEIEFELNGEKTTAQTDGNENLGFLLKRLGVKSIQEMFENLVLKNGKIVPAFLIPAPIASGSKIVTIEGFSKTKEFADINAGFRKAKINPCTFCVSSRILATHELLERSWLPSPEECEEFSNLFDCACTEKGAFQEAVLFATALKHARESGRRN